MFTKSRDRLPTTAIAGKVMAAILAHRQGAPLLSDAPFSVDGTLVKAWAPMKSFRPKPDAASFESGDGPPPPSTDAEAEASAEASSNPRPHR